MKQLKTPLRTVLILYSVLVTAQNESDFYTPQNGGITKNLKTNYGVDNNFVTNDSQKLQKAINDVTNSGGGKIIIPKGNYSFTNIQLKSNVRLEIDKGVIIRPFHVPSGNYTIFDLGRKGATIENISIKGIGGRFTIDLKEVTNNRVFAFTCSKVTNFEIANFNVLDKNTLFQSVGLGHSTYNGVHYVPKKGIIKNANADDAHYGYGLIQIQAGENILFKNLSGRGGVTLRLESGWEVMNKIQPAALTPKIKNIYGRNIRCTKGQAAVMLSPHTIDQGFVDIRNITGISCEFAAKIDKGHVNTTRYAGFNLTPGTFDKNSSISNIKATYGKEAEVRAMFLRFIPCDLRADIGPRNIDEDGFYTSPACAPVGNFAAGLFVGKSPTNIGSYSIKISDIQSSGYSSSVPDIVTGDNCDYEDCTAINGFRIWIPKKSKNTRGNCNINATFLTTNKTNTSNKPSFSIYSHSPNNKVTIELGQGFKGLTEISIINILGKVVLQKSIIDSSTSLNMDDFKGIYLIKMKNLNKIYTKKLVFN